MVIISCPNIFTSLPGLHWHLLGRTSLKSTMKDDDGMCDTHMSVLWRQSRVGEQRSRGRKNEKSWNGKSRRAAETSRVEGGKIYDEQSAMTMADAERSLNIQQNLQRPLLLFDQHTEFTSMIPVYCKTSRLMLLFRALKKRKKKLSTA